MELCLSDREADKHSKNLERCTFDRRKVASSVITREERNNLIAGEGTFVDDVMGRQARRAVPFASLYFPYVSRKSERSPGKKKTRQLS